MDHVALNGAGADDGDFDHQIVKDPRAQFRQHRHLRAAFDLKHPQTVAPAEHVVGRPPGGVVLVILHRDGGQFQRAVVMRLDQIKAFGDTGEHAKGEDIDLEDLQRVDVVLVPFDETALGHGAVADRHDLGQRAFGEDETADVLG